MKSIKEVLIQQDEMKVQEAEELIRNARNQLHRYLEQGDLDAAYYICEEYFGLEPDYIMQLM